MELPLGRGRYSRSPDGPTRMSDLHCCKCCAAKPPRPSLMQGVGESPKTPLKTHEIDIPAMAVGWRGHSTHEQGCDPAQEGVKSRCLPLMGIVRRAKRMASLLIILPHTLAAAFNFKGARWLVGRDGARAAKSLSSGVGSNQQPRVGRSTSDNPRLTPPSRLIVHGIPHTHGLHCTICPARGPPLQLRLGGILGYCLHRRRSGRPAWRAAR